MTAGTVPGADPFASIAAAAAMMDRKAISPVELVRHCLNEIARVDDRLHSFVHVDSENALAEAAAAERRMVDGRRRGPLDGIPIAHKDLFETRGVPTRAQSRLLEDNVPRRDAAAVRRLRAAGAVSLGKLTTIEFAIGAPLYGGVRPAARNPWDAGVYTGGSSSGTAAAVAAGLIFAGTGSDTGGSIRSPAAFCGVTGLKPSYGLVDTRGLLPLAPTLDHAGPIARSAADCALLLQALAAARRRPARREPCDGRQPLHGLRIGLIAHFHEIDRPAEPAVQEAVRRAGDLLRSLGAQVHEVRLPPLAEFHACWAVIQMTEAFAQHRRDLRERGQFYGETTRRRLLLGALSGGADYVEALAMRQALADRTEQAMASIDLLLTAVQPGEAPPIDRLTLWGFIEAPGFNAPFNLTGQPAISLPAGFGPRGLPLAVQLVGRKFAEDVLLRAAVAYEREAGWISRRPPALTTRDGARSPVPPGNP